MLIRLYNSLADNRVFNFLKNYIAVTTHFVDEKLRLSLNYQQVNFYQNKDNFNNLNFEMVYKDKKHRYFVILNNVFNERNFIDRKSTRLNSSHVRISYAVFCLKKKKKSIDNRDPLITCSLPTAVP